MTTPTEQQLDDLGIVLEAGLEIDALHGTVHAPDYRITEFVAQQPRAANRWASGETIPSLAATAGVWLTENGAIAQQYCCDEDSTRQRDGDGFVYSVTANPRITAWISWTDEEAVSAALAAGADCLYLEDRQEILVIDPDCLDIYEVTNHLGEVV